MVCSSTPFITGRPYTMFFNDKVYSEGAVGVAISGVSRSFHLDFPVNLKPITPEAIITRSVSHIVNLCTPSNLHFYSVEGNLIKSIDNINPTRMLLKAIETAAIHNFKEDDFYLVLVQGGQVRIGLSSINTTSDISPRRNAFSASLPGIQAVEQYPSSHMRHHLKGPRCRYGMAALIFDAVDIF
jgi:hypothetical protein